MENNICECGHEKGTHAKYSEQHECLRMLPESSPFKLQKRCPCKKFKPVSEKKKVLLFCDNPACFATHLAKNHYMKTPKNQSPLSQDSVREKKKSDLVGVTRPSNETSRDTQNQARILKEVFEKGIPMDRPITYKELKAFVEKAIALTRAEQKADFLNFLKSQRDYIDLDFQYEIDMKIKEMEK